MFILMTSTAGTSTISWGRRWGLYSRSILGPCQRQDSQVQTDN